MITTYESSTTTPITVWWNGIATVHMYCYYDISHGVWIKADLHVRPPTLLVNESQHAGTSLKEIILGFINDEYL